MTIGIAATGNNAGQAIFEALAAVERVARGAIGGYAVFAAITEDGVLYRAETQRGGSTTLFTEGETTGTPPPPHIASATRAALMSSGPDRPEPLSQFLPADPDAGLVTGHRLPNAIGATGKPVNLAVLELMRAGCPASEAVDRVLAGDPESDAGIIAVDHHGQIHARNSARVARRPDLGHARLESASGAAIVEVLHNAIHPHRSLAALAADIAMEILAPAGPPHGYCRVRAGTPIQSGLENRVYIDADGLAQRIEVVDTRLLEGRHNCAAIYLGARVIQQGQCVGMTTYEPNILVEAARILTLSGQDEVSITYRQPQEPRQP